MASAYSIKKISATGIKNVIRRMATAATSSATGNGKSLNENKTYVNYDRLIENLKIVNKNLQGKPLTLAEKILYSHLVDPASLKSISRGQSYLKLRPDRVAMQDASAQTAILQFMLANKETAAVPSSVHCDHLIQAHFGADSDLVHSIENNKEIFSFLESASKKYGLSFWKPGSGIIHQIVLENYATPGVLMLGTDSHTPNAGGLGMLAIGVGGADAVDAMTNIPWELKTPKILGVRLTGELSGWTSPKDVILHLAGILSVKGGTNHIIEYFGPGVPSLTCTGMATICNMGAEVGATTSIFPYSDGMSKYLDATGRRSWRLAVDRAAESGLFEADRDAEYDKVIEINLSALEPHLNGPFTPDAAAPLSKIMDKVNSLNSSGDVSACLIGSCTNSSYEDMDRAASIAKQALQNGLKAKTEFFVTPGSEQIRATIERDGQSKVFTQAGGIVLANACGPCIGQWKRTDDTKNKKNIIMTSFNRNFKARNDGNSQTMNFLASPEIVTAMAFAGNLSFNPTKDTLLDAQGKPFKFSPPDGKDLPSSGFEQGKLEYQPVLAKFDPSIEINIDPSSSRLERLEPFQPWHGQEFKDMRVLVKVKGKCTTDHISAAGPWLKFKGHLDNLANNTLIGAVNAFTDETNKVKNVLTGESDTIPNVARAYKAKHVSWVVIGDENYGEGSAREHAALQPRYLGCNFIIARSFARIHETNLKKQGIVPATFENLQDYNKIKEDSILETVGLVGLTPTSTLTLKVIDPITKNNEIIPLRHTMSEDQIQWFKAGSALNMIAAKNASS